MTFLFWFCAVLVVYIYIGYPICLAIISRVKAKGSISSINETEKPMVSILIAAFNEEQHILATLKNKVEQDYPAELLEILVVSDDSQDATDQIVSDFAKTSDVPVRLVRQFPRAGKTSGLNLLMPEAKGEIVFFSDANSLWATDVVSNHVAMFSEADVGYVTGKMVYVNEDGSLIGDGCSAYMKYENWLRERETAIGSVVGVDGGVDAVRKALYKPMRADQLPDFVLPLSVVDQGYRVVYQSASLLKEQSLQDVDSEYRMRVRVALRAMWALFDMRHLFNFSKDGLFAWQLISHKLLRYLAFIPLLIVFVSSLLLAGNGFYLFTFFVQVLFYLLALVGFLSASDDPPAWLALPYYFVVLNWACAHAFLRFMKGEKQAIWNPRVG